MRFSLYVAVSTLLTCGTILNAYLSFEQFYPAVVSLVTFKSTVLILGNMAFVLVLLFGRLTKSMFFGRLREAESEIIWENTRYTVTETGLALTIFRDELSTRFVLYFAALLFSKVFHWLCDARVEHVEQAQETSRLNHFRMVSLMNVLFMTDIAFTATAVYSVSQRGPSAELLFGFEFMVLCITIVTTFVRYCLSVIDLHFVQGRWYNKSLYELYMKLVMDTIQLLVYVVFFGIVFTYYGVPFHLVRQLYIAMKNVYDRMFHFLRFRRITQNLNERFANATEQELEDTDKICIICREEMVSTTRPSGPKKLPCGHIFHFYCLRTWLERQLSCPTCRANIPATAAAAAGPAAAAAQRQEAGQQEPQVVDRAAEQVPQALEGVQPHNPPPPPLAPTDPREPVHPADQPPATHTTEGTGHPGDGGQHRPDGARDTRDVPQSQPSSANDRPTGTQDGALGDGAEISPHELARLRRQQMYDRMFSTPPQHAAPSGDASAESKHNHDAVKTEPNVEQTIAASSSAGAPFEPTGAPSEFTTRDPTPDVKSSPPSGSTPMFASSSSAASQPSGGTPMFAPLPPFDAPPEMPHGTFGASAADPFTSSMHPGRFSMPPHQHQSYYNAPMFSPISQVLQRRIDMLELDLRMYQTQRDAEDAARESFQQSMSSSQNELRKRTPAQTGVSGDEEVKQPHV